MFDAILDYKPQAVGFLTAIAAGQVAMHADLPLTAKGALVVTMLVIFLGAYATLIKRKHGEWKAHDLKAAAAIESGAVFRKFNLLNVLSLWSPLVVTIAAIPVLFLLISLHAG